MSKSNTTPTSTQPVFLFFIYRHDYSFSWSLTILLNQYRGGSNSIAKCQIHTNIFGCFVLSERFVRFYEPFTSTVLVWIKLLKCRIKNDIFQQKDWWSGFKMLLWFCNKTVNYSNHLMQSSLDIIAIIKSFSCWG